MNLKPMKREFFLRDTKTVGEELIGKYLVRKRSEGEIIVQITETESYCGPEDKACHAYGWRNTKRVEPLYMMGGHAYVYLIYGMYYCLNVVTEPEGMPCAVLIRSGEIIRGADFISSNRFGKKYGDLNGSQKKNLMNGPGKLCIGLQIGLDLNKSDMIGEDQLLYLAEDTIERKVSVEKTPRIGIEYAQEYADKLWRFIKKS